MLLRNSIFAAAFAISACGVATTLDDVGTDGGGADVGMDAGVERDGGSDVGIAASCRHQSDCPVSFACVGGMCAAEVPCMSSTMCAGLLCSTFLGRCVECLADTDCGSTERCRGHVCSAPVSCNSDRDCTANGEICDMTAGVCTECGSDVDCDEAYFCGPDGACALDVCTPGQIVCFGAGTAPCLPSGAGPGVATPCPSGRCTGGACAPPFDAGIDAGHDGGTDGGHDAGPPAAWEMMPAGGLVQHPGWSDATPVGGGDVFYAVTGGTTPEFARFDGATGAWTTLSSASAAPFGMPTYFAGMAWVGNALYLMSDIYVYRYDIVSASWSNVVLVSMTSWAQSTHDESGHVFAVTGDNRIATYTIATNTVSYQAFGRDAPVTGPRIAWDATTHLLYVVPNFALATMYSFDPATGNITARASLPATRATPTFCGDRHGRIYAAGDNNGTFLSVYDIATNTWSMLSQTLPFDHNANGACTVTDDGYLYYTDVGNRLARLRVR
jgi:hypothetical protein